MEPEQLDLAKLTVSEKEPTVATLDTPTSRHPVGRGAVKKQYHNVGSRTLLPIVLPIKEFVPPKAAIEARTKNTEEMEMGITEYATPDKEPLDPPSEPFGKQNNMPDTMQAPGQNWVMPRQPCYDIAWPEMGSNFRGQFMRPYRGFRARASHYSRYSRRMIRANAPPPPTPPSSPTYGRRFQAAAPQFSPPVDERPSTSQAAIAENRKKPYPILGQNALPANTGLSKKTLLELKKFDLLKRHY